MSEESGSEFEEIPTYVPTETATPEPIVPAKRKRGKARTWVLVDEFISPEDALAAVPKNEYGTCSTTRGDSGAKVFYKCRLDQSCSYQRMLYYPSHSRMVELFESGEHCDHVESSATGLKAETKNRIKEVYSLGVTTPKTILATIRRDNIQPIPSLMQIRNFLSRWKQSNVSNGAITLSDLVKLSDKHRSIPYNLDEVFVLNILHEVESSIVTSFQVIFSTKRLLSLGRYATNCHLDGTYKLVYQGYPVLILGFTDKDHTFHPIALSLSKNERAKDYYDLLRTVETMMCHIFGPEVRYQPSILISDASMAIKSGFTKWRNTNEIKMITCWAHVIANIDKHRCKIKEVALWEQIRGDIEILQLSASPEIFAVAKELFLKKYKKEPGAQDFIEYFEKQWLDQLDTWYEGYCSGHPSTNNALEATNNNIKRENTYRKRLRIEDFFEVVTSNIVFNWSVDRRDKEKVIVDKPTITLDIWTKAYQWAIDDRIKNKTKDNDNLVFCASSTLKKKLHVVVPKFIRLWNTLGWKSFDEYSKWYKTIWILQRKEGEVIEYSCSCPTYQKEYICKHSVGVLIRLDKVNVPDAAKAIPIGEKRPKGRPAKAKGARERQ
jgi:MULE transposase domain/SWIM zinc finger